MPNWRDIECYTKNSLFEGLRGEVFTLEYFIEKGKENYGLKENTCKQKLQRGLREGLVARMLGSKFQVVSLGC